MPMISSFLNLCRACPMPADNKFSEYKTNYKWYESYSTPTVDQPTAVRKATDLTVVSTEPAIPRRRKHPEVAYRSNHAVYHVDPAVAAERARSKEKSMANSRSRSADPNMGRKSVVVNPISEYEVPYQRNKQPDADPNLKCKALNTESSAGGDPKSGVITEQPPSTRLGKVTEYKAKFRPFSAYEYVDGNWKEPITTTVVLAQPTNEAMSWYQEVVNTRKKAEENKSRARYSTLESDHFEELYKRQVALWSQVSSRYMLSALSLASSQHTPKKQKSKNKRPATAPVTSRRTSQSPQKSPQKKIADGSDAHSSDTTSPVKSEGYTRPKSPKKHYTRPYPSVPGNTQSKLNPVSKPKKNEDRKVTDNKISNRPTTLAATPRMKSQPSSRTNDNLPRTHSKPKPKASINNNSNPAADGSTGKIWLKPSVTADKKQDSPSAINDNESTSPTKNSTEALKPCSDDADLPVEPKNQKLGDSTGEKVDNQQPAQHAGVPTENFVNGVPSPRVENSGRTTSTPASQNSPHHLAQKPKPATEIPQQVPHHQKLIDDSTGHNPGSNGRNFSSKPVATNPDEVLDKARNRLDEFWNSSD